MAADELTSATAEDTQAAGEQLARTLGPGAVYSKAQEMGLSLKPTNQSPYNRRTTT